MKQELINLLENIHKIIKDKLSVIDEGSLNGECAMVVLSGGEKHSFVAGWKMYEEFVKYYLEI